MATMETSLLNRYLKRACNLSGVSYTKQQLIEMCERDIRYDGPDAKTSVQLKGVRGQGLKKRRRLFPSGPLGEVRSVYESLLIIEFPSGPLLSALGTDFDVACALAHHYTEQAEPAYPTQMTVELAVKFAHENLRVEFEHEVIEALCQSNPCRGYGNAQALIRDLLSVEQTALKNRWKRVELAKWKAAGLHWPIVQFQPSNFRPIVPSLVSQIVERRAKLLQLFDACDEAGKQHIEQAAAFAAARKSAAKPVAKTSKVTAAVTLQ